MRPFWLAVLAFAAVAIAQEGTSISGDITGIAFKASQSPYIVEQDVIVPANKTVVVPQGCVLLFRNFTGMQVKGRLVLDGKQDNPVIFTSIHDGEYNPSSTQLPNPFDWNGVFIAQESDGTFLNNFHLRYSVYGVKSQSQNVIIQNGVFKQNGQFHFTVNDEIQYVQDEIPFSYGDEDDIDMPGVTTGGKKESSSKAGRTNQDGPAQKKRTAIRIGTLGIGVVCTGVSVFTGVRSAQAYNDLQTMSSLQDSSGNNNRFQDTNTEYRTNAAASIITGIFAALGYAGFGLTFAF